MALTQVTDLKYGDTFIYQGEARLVDEATPYKERETKIATQDGRSIILANTNWFEVNRPEDTCEAMTDAPEGEDVCEYGDGVGYCGLVPGHGGKHLCNCGEHTF